MYDRIRKKTVKHALQLFEAGHSIKEIKTLLSLLFPKHNKANIEMIIEKSIEMCSSLQKATDEAGGSGWSIDALCKMTVIDLISTLGTNNIRFIYTKRNHRKNKGIKNDKLS